MAETTSTNGTGGAAGVRLTTTPLTPARTALATLLIVFVCSLFLEHVSSLFLFGGHGFGTVFGQTLLWLSWSVLRQTRASDIQIVINVVAALLSTAGYAAVVAVTFLALRKRPSVARIAVWVAFSLYVVGLFIFPQAVFGP